MRAILLKEVQFTEKGNIEWRDLMILIRAPIYDSSIFLRR